MKIALEWLREWAPDAGTDAAHLAETLTMGGLEVEDFAPGASFDQVVVARVLKVERHPNADRLAVCQVDAGESSPRTIVCGAPNVAAGLLVPCALPGAKLPNDVAIVSSNVRGVRSDGMLCSARELALSEDSQGLLVLEPNAVPGANLATALGLDEPVFEIKTTPNRGDCLSVMGVARELAALTGTQLRPLSLLPARVTTKEILPVRVEAPELCGRFSGRILRGVNARAATPAWMRRRLELSGQRSISALVDISNYVMLELGQPSHVFDLQKVAGGLQVRWGRAGESIALLNDQTIGLDPGTGVVADERGPKAIAGIMGGSSSAVSLDTRDVYLEAAFWWPESIQGRQRRLNFSTEAAHRFERGVDFAGTGRALERLTQLILEICGTESSQVGPLDDTILRLPERNAVAMRTARAQRVLGVRVDAAQVAACFERLGLAFTRAGDDFQVTPPSYRFDLEIEEDLIEEVARVHGFARIPSDPPLAPARMRARREGERGTHDLRRAMAQFGYQELINYSFVPDSWQSDFGMQANRTVRVLNPIASTMSVMRGSLVPGLVANLRYNLNRQAERVRTFEIGKVFALDNTQVAGPEDVAGVRQTIRLAALAYGPAQDEQWGNAARPVDFFDAKGDLERLFEPLVAEFGSAAECGPDWPLLAVFHPGRCAAVFHDGVVVGGIGELHPRLCKVFELPSPPVLFEIETGVLSRLGLPSAQPVPRFPAVVRDIAVWVDASVRAGELLTDLQSLPSRDSGLGVVRAVRLFDVFRPRVVTKSAKDGTTESPTGLLNKEKSLAFRVVMQDTSRSLADADADAARASIVQHLQSRWGARVRE